ncbi:MAG: acetate--CoA ligase family protein [Pseudomonadota bacterium]
MNPGDILAEAAAAGHSALTEDRAKALLAAYGVPVVSERVCANAATAVTAADAVGYPVVLKAVGPTLLHKTESGLVRLHLMDAEKVRSAAGELLEAAGDAASGIVVQRQVSGRRELVAGMFRDPQFGPVVMLGLGGIFTEALADVTFRLAPLSDTDAVEMVSELRSKALFGAFRSEAPVDLRQLSDTLTGLGRIAVERPEIAEIDINPLIADTEGSLCAVDALVVLGSAQPFPSAPAALPVPPAAIGSLFYPRSIAFVGASAQMGKWGNMLLSNTISGGYGGAIYLVNPKGGTIADRPVYKTLADVPGPVDLAVVTLPAANVIDLVPQCRDKGISNILLITSGFGETGPEGKALETRLVAAAADAGILILGPNTMGICNPHINLYCTGSPVKPIAGATAMVAQSGNMGTQLLAFAEGQGIGIRAFSGSGNEAMITIEDYLDGFEVDDVTRIVMLYIESVKNGRRFFESACRVGKKKPIILLKGGQSSAGNRAAASHTGAMTSDSRVFDAVCRQAGIVKVEHPMDLLDLSAAFSSLPLPAGGRVAIMTLGGGWGVVTADLCARYGLKVPELPADMVARIDTLLPPYWSRANPVDIVGENDPSLPMIILEELMKWDGCDGVINLGIMGRRIFVDRMVASVQKADPKADPAIIAAAKQMLVDFEAQYIRHIVTLMDRYNKPVFGVRLLTDAGDPTVCRVAGSDTNSVFYETPERAVKAFAKMVEYYRYHNRGCRIDSI